MKKIIIPILILSLFLLSACSNTDDTVTTSGGAFIGGSQGIIASFEPLSIIDPDSGIYTVFDTEDFPLDIVLKNKGEEDLLAGKVKLRLLGPAREDFSNIEPADWVQPNVEEIEKISEFNPEGGEEIVSFTPNNRALYATQVTGFTDVNWNLEYEYEYKTHLIINDVCFKGDITDPKVCEVKEPKTFSVSGAPITITAVEEDTAGKGIVLLKVTVVNVGDGESAIVGQEFDKRFEQISYTVSEPEKWDCKSGGRANEARLLENTATIICRLKTPLGEDDLYTKNIRLTLDYNYRQLIQEKLRIKESAS